MRRIFFGQIFGFIFIFFGQMFRFTHIACVSHRDDQEENKRVPVTLNAS